MVYLIMKTTGKGLSPDDAKKLMAAAANPEIGKGFDWDKYGPIYDNVISSMGRFTGDGPEAMTIVKVHEDKLEKTMALFIEWSSRFVLLGAQVDFQVFHSAEELVPLMGFA
ncbi:MAG: hypothetical protein ACFFCS_14370 [Candidatus Hodarchaeota archaeon]